MSQMKGVRNPSVPVPRSSYVCARCGRVGERNSKSTKRACCRDCHDADREYVMLLIAPTAASPARAGPGPRPSKPSERKVKA